MAEAIIPAIFLAVGGASVKAIVTNLILAAVVNKILAPRNVSARNTSNFKKTVLSTIESRKVVYGDAMLSGPIAFMETEQEGSVTFNKWLHQIIVLTTTPVNDIKQIVIDDQVIDISGTEGTNDLDGAGPTQYELNTGKLSGLVKIIKVTGQGQSIDGFSDAADVIRATDIRAEIPAGKWTTSHKLTDCSYIYLKFTYDEEKFSGFPKSTCVVEGKPLYDPRKDLLRTDISPVGGHVDWGFTGQNDHRLADKSTWEWAEAGGTNWALCTLDYLLDSRYGVNLDLGKTILELEWQLVADAADSSSETVVKGDTSGNIMRYQCDGIIDTASTPIDIMEALLSTAAGLLAYSQGQYKLYSGEYSPPQTANDIISDSDVVGSLNIRTNSPRAELFNKVSGIYIQETLELTGTPGTTKPIFEPTDFPLVDPGAPSNPYEIIDGEEIIRDLDFPFVLSPYQAQRVGKIVLDIARQPIIVSGSFNINFFKYAPGNTIYLDIDRLGWDATVQNGIHGTPYYKQFKVISTEFNVKEDELVIDATLKEEASELYDWNNGDALAFDPAPNSSFSFDTIDSTVLLPTGLAVTTRLTTNNDGSIVPLADLTWNSPTTGAGLDRQSITKYELQYKLNADANWTILPLINIDRAQTAQGPITILNLDNTTGITYDFRVRSISFLGTKSLWNTITAQQLASSLSIDAADGITVTTGGKYFDILVDLTTNIVTNTRKDLSHVILVAATSNRTRNPEVDLLEDGTDWGTRRVFLLPVPNKISTDQPFVGFRMRENKFHKRWFWAAVVNTSGTVSTWEPNTTAATTGSPAGGISIDLGDIRNLLPNDNAFDEQPGTTSDAAPGGGPNLSGNPSNGGPEEADGGYYALIP